MPMFDDTYRYRLKFAELKKAIEKYLNVDFNTLNPAIMSEEDDAYGELKYTIAVKDIPVFKNQLKITGSAEVMSFVIRKCPEMEDGYVRRIVLWEPDAELISSNKEWVARQNLECLYYQIACNGGKLELYDVNDEQHISWKDIEFGSNNRGVFCVTEPLYEIVQKISNLVYVFTRVYGWVEEAIRMKRFDRMESLDNINDLEAFVDKQIARHYKKYELRQERDRGLE